MLCLRFGHCDHIYITVTVHTTSAFLLFSYHLDAVEIMPVYVDSHDDWHSKKLSLKPWTIILNIL